MKRALLLCAALLVPRGLHCAPRQETGFLVLAPDRGFLGDEEIKDAFEEYRKSFNAALAFLGPRESAASLQEGLSELRSRGAREIVALPLFASERHPWLKAARVSLAREKPAVRVAPALSGHYLAAEILADRLGRLSRDPASEGLLLVAQGADGPENARELEEDLLKTARLLGGRFPFARQEAVALQGWDPRDDRSDGRLREALEELRRSGLKPVLVCLDLTTKLDSMMTLSARLSGLAREVSAAFDGADLTPHPAVALWLAQESNRRLPVTERELGVVFMPHGADLHWNRVMLQAIKALEGRFMIEPAFGMADPALIERAVRKLETRGARAIVVLRVFSLKESFSDATEYALGLRPAPAQAHHHGPHPMGSVPGPIRSGCPFHTTGGFEDSPLFAAALADRALNLSRRPSSETVFLLAHGAGSDEENRRWLEVLRSLAAQVKDLAALKGARFKDVRYGAWREDWPDKRAAAAQAIREEVRQASADGAAIVIPARSALDGPERELLSGLDYAFDGQSFAPHPKFVQWVEGEIRASLDYFNSQREALAATRGSSGR